MPTPEKFNPGVTLEETPPQNDSSPDISIAEKIENIKKEEKKRGLGDINNVLMAEEKHLVVSVPKKVEIVRTKDPVRIGRQDLATQIQKKKEDYINDYTKSVKKKWGITRGLIRLGNWFGITNKHDVKAAQEKEDAYYERRDLTLDQRENELSTAYANGERVRNKRFDKDGNETVNFTEALMRYRRIREKIESRREEQLEKMKVERDSLHASREKAWTTEKEEKFKAEFMKNLNKVTSNVVYKTLLGNRYVRFALISGLVGAATGGLGSAAFWATKSARFVGGAVAGAGTKKLLDKKFNEGDMFKNEIDELDLAYKNKIISGKEYDKQRTALDAKVNRWKSGKTLAGLAVGVGAAELSSDYLATPLQEGVETAIDHAEKGIEFQNQMMQEAARNTVESLGRGAEYVKDSAGNLVERIRSMDMNPFDGNNTSAGIPVPEDGGLAAGAGRVAERVTDQIPAVEIAYPEAMQVSSRGALDTIAKFKDQLHDFYDGKPTAEIPPLVQHMFDTPDNQLTQELGLYDPNAADGAESHTMPKGSTIGFKDNMLQLHNVVTGEDTPILINTPMGFVSPENHLDMFDSDAHELSHLGVDEKGNITPVQQPDAPIEGSGKTGGMGAPGEREILDNVKDEPIVTEGDTAEGAQTEEELKKQIAEERQKLEEEKQRRLAEIEEKYKVENKAEVPVTPSSEEVETIVSDEPIVKENPQDILPREEEVVPVVEEKNGEGLQNAESLEIISREVPPVEFEDTSTLEGGDTPETPEKPVTETAPVPGTREVFSTSGNGIEGNIAVVVNDSGEYVFGPGSDYRVSSGLRDSIRIGYGLDANQVTPEQVYLQGGSTIDNLTDNSVDEGTLMNRLVDYQVSDAIIKSGAFAPGSPVYQAAQNSIESTKVWFEGKYGTGILRDVYAPVPAR